MEAEAAEAALLLLQRAHLFRAISGPIETDRLDWLCR